jgi:RNA polymerase sigma-70 factor (ECF subfamily)
MGASLDAIGEQFERCQREWFRRANFMLRNVDEANEVVAEAALTACVASPTFRGDGDLQTWLYVIAHNCARMRRRRRVRSIVETPGTMDHWPSQQQTVEQALIQEEARRLIQVAVRPLGPKVSRTFDLVYSEGLSYRQAAERLGIPYNSVKWRMVRALRLIRSKQAELGAVEELRRRKLEIANERDLRGQL